jgi:hypothetical protein
VVILIAVVAFLVVIIGSIALGRWLQAKGREMERNPNDTD